MNLRVTSEIVVRQYSTAVAHNFARKGKAYEKAEVRKCN
jgi:hypothetical protein